MTVNRKVVFICVLAVWSVFVAYISFSTWPEKPPQLGPLPERPSLEEYQAGVAAGRITKTYQEHFAEIQSRRQRILATHSAIVKEYPDQVKVHLLLSGIGLIMHFALFTLFKVGRINIKSSLVNRKPGDLSATQESIGHGLIKPAFAWTETKWFAECAHCGVQNDVTSHVSVPGSESHHHRCAVCARDFSYRACPSCSRLQKP